MKRLLTYTLPFLVFISLILNFFLLNKKTDNNKDYKKAIIENAEDNNKRIKAIADNFISDNKKYLDINFYTTFEIQHQGKNKKFVEFNPVVKQCIKLGFLYKLDMDFTQTFENEKLHEEVKNELREFYYKIKKQIDKEKHILYDVYPGKISAIDKAYLDQIK